MLSCRGVLLIDFMRPQEECPDCSVSSTLGRQAITLEDMLGMLGRFRTDSFPPPPHQV